MLSFRLRREKPSFACVAPNSTYWNVYEKSKKVGWFGVFTLGTKQQYTDIQVYPKYRGQGYFKQIYDHFVKYYWDGKQLCAFVSRDNSASVRAHEKYGCKIVKENQSTDVYLVRRTRGSYN